MNKRFCHLAFVSHNPLFLAALFCMRRSRRKRNRKRNRKGALTQNPDRAITSRTFEWVPWEGVDGPPRLYDRPMYVAYATFVSADSNLVLDGTPLLHLAAAAAAAVVWGCSRRHRLPVDQLCGNCLARQVLYCYSSSVPRV